MAVASQLPTGIRFLDIRGRHFNNGLPIHHDSNYLDCNFGDVQNQCVQFLQDNPTECIIMRVKEEYKAHGNSNTYEQAFMSYVNGTAPGYPNNYFNYWYFGQTIPQIGDVRSKIVLLREFALDNGSGPLGMDVTAWGNNTTFWINQPNSNGYNPSLPSFYIQDNYSQIASSVGKKWEEIQSMLEYSKSENSSGATNSNIWCVDFTSASGGMFPFTFATGATSNYHGQQTDGGLNNKLFGYLNPQQPGVTGWGTIAMDFPESQGSSNTNSNGVPTMVNLVNLIYSLNF